jgi:hypothetical protein
MAEPLGNPVPGLTRDLIPCRAVGQKAEVPDQARDGARCS